MRKKKKHNMEKKFACCTTLGMSEFEYRSPDNTGKNKIYYQ